MKKMICLVAVMLMATTLTAQINEIKSEIAKLPDYPTNVTSLQGLCDYYLKLEKIYLKHRVVKELQHEAEPEDERTTEMEQQFEQMGEEFEGLSEEEIVAKAMKMRNEGKFDKITSSNIDPQKMEAWQKMMTEFNQKILPEKNRLYAEANNDFEGPVHQIVAAYHKAISDGMGPSDPAVDAQIESEYNKMMPKLESYYNTNYRKDSLCIRRMKQYDMYLTKTYLPFMERYHALSKEVLPALSQGRVDVEKELPNVEDQFREALLQMLDSRIKTTDALVRYLLYKQKAGIMFLVFPNTYPVGEEQAYHPNNFIYYDLPKIIKDPNGDGKNEQPSNSKNEKVEKAKKILKSIF